ncbi:MULTISPECIES: class IV adenylate cyclase [Actinoalloteichus]|uniref:Adenylate cyclase, class 2 (Thermophilic) n=1 Tax=Actinoalloteichus fjordicus TaxID=1612552 RepID=A0AAC9LB20_9PSEU|nr:MULTISPECIES: CYTH domain-containing protein [Actinoalloteichus]APU14296.1 adenylate cyclase, class 2 (thermophilic) [Actinoalloteichus fjordicus]APU20265.1 adenylate cyclase, class 2 (thermophilic) [Actinoalloteichus sp. GBA129-24]
MATEYEAKILDVSVDAVRQALRRADAEFIGETAQRRYVFDIVEGDAATWMRLRDNGTVATLSVKKIEHDGIGGTHEWETAVGDFAETLTFLSRLGYEPKSYQENRRESYRCDGAEIEIDTWPLIPPYVEIEAATRDRVVATAARLGFVEHQLTGENTTKVYARYGIDLTRIRELRFPE